MFHFSGVVGGVAQKSGPAELNSPMRVDTAPEGEDIARENWSKHEQKTPPHALSGIQGKISNRKIQKISKQKKIIWKN